VSEYPVKLPMIDLRTIGAGGGSIAWVDDLGVLHVGPQSAGSDPGPACYGWGGELPTVTDANCVLGRLNPRYFLGGRFDLKPDRAAEAIRRHVADKMGLTVEEAALNIVKIVNANMAKGISKVSMEKGYDLRDFALIAFGGAAPLHACELAEGLEIGSVIVPFMNGGLSAVGLAISEVQHDYVKTIAKKAQGLSPEELSPTSANCSRRGLGSSRGRGSIGPKRSSSGQPT